MSSTIITILALTVATGVDAFVSTVLHPTKSISQTSLFAKGRCRYYNLVTYMIRIQS